MKHVVIIASAQFGYHIDTYYYCKYLKDKCQVTYIGWNQGFPPIMINGVDVISVCRQGGPYRVIRFLRAVWNQTKQKNTVVFIKYFKFLSWIIRIIRIKNPMVFDIRTGSVERNKLVQQIHDGLMKVEALLFKNITVISSELARKLNLEDKAVILPLGAEVISTAEKHFAHCRMLYVGTLHNRNIENVIKGLSDYLSQSDNTEKVFLTIVGDGLPGQLDALIAETNRVGIYNFIEFKGRVPHDQLKPIFDNHNIGISYIPMTSYYDNQPPTKTFEYLMSGMPVIATKTNANKLIINHENGILIGETPREVCIGIKEMVNRRNHFSSNKIRAASQEYSWSRIVDNLFTYLVSIK